MFKILLLDTNDVFVNHLKTILEEENYLVKTHSDGIDALELAKDFLPQVVLLDIPLHGIDGIETCIELRKLSEFKKAIVIFYTDRVEDYSQISAFEAGADDYVFKSIKPRLLLCRIKALLKRNFSENLFTPAPPIGISLSKGVEVLSEEEGIVIDRDRYLIFRNGEELMLPRKEFELLSLLSTDKRKTFTRQEISKRIWGYDVFEKNRTIDVHIGRLREKIGINSIKTIKGIGYRLEL